MADGDLLGQASAEAVGAGDDDAVLDAQFHEGVAAGADLGEEVLVRDGDLAVLVTALLLVGDLVLDLQGAGTRLDHLLGQEVGGLGIAEAGVDIGDDRHDMGLVGVDRLEDRGFLGLVACRAGGVEVAEHHAEFAGVGLLEEGVELLDQGRHGGLLVHGLVRQGPEVRAQGGNHPA